MARGTKGNTRVLLTDDKESEPKKFVATPFRFAENVIKNILADVNDFLFA